MKRILFVILLLLYPTFAFSANEDLTTYTANNMGTITSAKADISGTEPATLYKDYTAAHFGDLDGHTFDYEITYDSGAQTQHGAILYGLSDTAAATTTDLDTANDGLTYEYTSWGAWRVYLWDYNGDSNDTSADAQCVGEDIHCYLTIDRSGGTATAYLYSDASRTTLEDTIAVSSSDTYRYLSAYGIFVSHPLYLVGYVQNYDLHEAAAGRTRRFF